MLRLRKINRLTDLCIMVKSRIFNIASSDDVEYEGPLYSLSVFTANFLTEESRTHREHTKVLNISVIR